MAVSPALLSRMDARGQRFYALEEPTSLNIIELIPELLNMGVAAVKIEGSATQPAYVEQVTKVCSAALGAYIKASHSYSLIASWLSSVAPHQLTP